MKKQRVNIVGGGIAGLSCAWKLIQLGGKDKYDIRIYEASDRCGGQLKHNYNGLDGIDTHFWVFLNSNCLGEIISTLDPDGFYLGNSNISFFLNDSNMSLYPTFAPNDILCYSQLLYDIVKYNTNIEFKRKCQSISVNDYAYNFMSSKRCYNAIRGIMSPFLFYGPASTCSVALNLLGTTFYKVVQLKPVFPTVVASINLEESLTLPMLKFIQENGVSVYTNNRITKRRNSYYDSNEQKLSGITVLAVDPLAAKQLFPNEDIVVENDEFRTVFTIYADNVVDNEGVSCHLDYWALGVNVNKFHNGCKLLAFIQEENNPGKLYGKRVKDCNKQEFEQELIAQVNHIVGPNAKWSVKYPSHIKFDKKTGLIKNVDPSKNMFLPVVNVYNRLVPITTDNQNVFRCGVYVQNTDPYFTVEASAESAFKVAELIHNK